MSIRAITVETRRAIQRDGSASVRIGAYPSRQLVFPRTQSPALRDCPWEERIKPMKSWSELAAYGFMALASVVLLTTFI